MKAAHNELRLLALVGSELRIDADGCVWRIAASPGGGHAPRPIQPRRAEHRMEDGYLRLAGNMGAGQIKALAHRLVWVFFHGQIPAGMEINHKNGVKDDNRPENLELVTPQANTRHRIDVLKHPAPRGYRHGSEKLTAADVAAIRASDQHPRVLALKHGVTIQTIRNAATGKTWRGIEHAPLFKSSTPSVPEADTPLPDKGIGGVDFKQEQLSEKGIA